nr:CRISPR system precrRNA processing endoribonuclease RAMP protein Cas6 [Pyrinomonadaceae bacterium]
HEKDLPLTGFVGKMQFAGDFTPFLELLLIGEIIHLGQQTTNGLGRYSLLF